MNEEDVKNKIVVPYLQELGFELSNMVFEMGFTLYLGHHKRVIGKDKDPRGRLDILVRYNSRNLFVIETKELDHKIDEKDKIQAISYASLLDQIAPFAIVSNGKDIRIYDVIKREDITGTRLKDSQYAKDGYTINVDLGFKYEALLRFIELDADNLLAFSARQVEDKMTRLTTIIDTYYPKYIAEVFVEREGLLELFRDFVDNNDKKCFIVTGNSGMGKTNVICWLANQMKLHMPVLFYNGPEIAMSLEDSIAEDFNWEFMRERSFRQYLLQLEMVLKTNNQTLLIFVDAVDEWPRSNAYEELNEFISHLNGNRIKICISCKTSKLKQLLFSKDIPSRLYQYLYTGNREPNIISYNRTYSFLLSKFSLQERLLAIQQYKKYFSLSGDITGNTLDECDDPMLLRILSIVYGKSGQSIPSSLNSPKILGEYLRAIVAKGDNEFQIISYLTRIASHLFKKDLEEVFESELVVDDHSSYDFLIEYNILNRTYDNQQRPLIRFNYDKLRDFVIAYHVKRLDTYSNEDMTHFALEYINRSIGYEVLSWYSMYCKTGHKSVLQKILEKEHKHKAMEFLSQYKKSLTKDFPFVLKGWKQDKINNMALIVLYDEDTNTVYRYGKTDGTIKRDDLIWLNKSQWKDESEFQLMLKYQTYSLHYAPTSNFTNLPAEELALRDSLEIANKLIIERRLDESKNVGIALEKLFKGLSQIGKALFGIPNYRDTPDYLDKILPLSCKELLDKIASLRGRIISFSSPFSYLFMDLDESIQLLCSKQNKIESPLLPLGDRTATKQLVPYPQDYTIERLKTYITSFFYIYLQEYRTLVETNFPTFKEQFSTYRLLPAYIVAELSTDQSNELPDITWCIFKNDTNKDEVEVSIKSKDSIFNLSNWQVRTAKGLKETNEVSGYLPSFFEMTNVYGNGYIIQDWVYQTIKKDFDEVFKKYRV
jgi:DNA replication protein DnaC